MALSTVVAGQSPQRLGSLSEDTMSTQLGHNLWVTLHRARLADGKALPTETLITYDITAQADGTSAFSVVDAVRGGRATLSYKALPGPTFFLPGTSREALTFAFGSCRKLHGYGLDMMQGLDAYLDAQLAPLERRPSLLVLNGDQIYADEVAVPILDQIQRLVPSIMGYHDEIPGLPTGLAKAGKRKPLVRSIGFTTLEGTSHVLTFGEYCLLYLIGWNEDLWPSSLATSNPNITAALEGAKASLPSVRRVLANCPTYMFFDDHEVTDDWNLDASWRARVTKSPGGRRVVANALGAFAMFQYLGNAPKVFPSSMVRAIADHASSLMQLTTAANAARAFDDVMWGFDQWSFATPSTPPILFVDTRTQRDFTGTQLPRLVSEAELRRVGALARRSGVKKRSTLILSLAVPVYGVSGVEDLQQLTDRYKRDHEHWMINLWSYIELMSYIAEELQPRHCVLLSGDVHFAYNLGVSFRQTRPHRRVGGPPPTGFTPLRIHQLTSSSIKNTPASFDAAFLRNVTPHVFTGTPGYFEVEDRAATWDVGSPGGGDPFSTMPPPVRSSVLQTKDPLFVERHEWKKVGGDYVMAMSNIGLVTVWPRQKRTEHALITGRRTGSEAEFWMYLSDLQ